MPSSYVQRPLRTFEEAAKARRIIRAQRMALKVCTDCGMPRHAETEWCEQHYLERLYAGEDR